jgi:hypothetical protein
MPRTTKRYCASWEDGPKRVPRAKTTKKSTKKAVKPATVKKNIARKKRRIVEEDN